MDIGIVPVTQQGWPLMDRRFTAKGCPQRNADKHDWSGGSRLQSRSHRGANAANVRVVEVLVFIDEEKVDVTLVVRAQILDGLASAKGQLGEKRVAEDRPMLHLARTATM